MRFLYTVVTILLTPFLLAHLFWRSLANPGYRQRIGERFGYYRAPPTPGSIWLHAVSVGEVQAAAALVRALQDAWPSHRLLVTTMTPTGSDRVRDLFGDSVDHCYVPYDLAGGVRRFFDAARPALAIVMETELWPVLYREAEQRGVPLILANARISPRSVGRYRKLGELIRATVAPCHVAAQSQADADRFLSLGAQPERTMVSGNLKFDFALPPDAERAGPALRQRHAANRPVWIAASTHAEEEQTVLAVHRRILATQPDTLLVIVPRHPERFAAVAALLQREGLAFVTRSGDETCPVDAPVLLGDTMGELMTLYAMSDVAFVGGSLIPIGGHNLLEPAALGLPVLTGPYNFNAAEIAALLQAQGAARIVTDSDELTEWLIRLLRDPAERARLGKAGRAAVQANRGALRRLLALIERLLPPAQAG